MIFGCRTSIKKALLLQAVCRIFSLVGCCLAVCCLLGGGNALKAQEVKVWEFAPYNVTLWYSFEAGTNLSSSGKKEFLRQLDQALERTFRAAWKTSLAELPSQLAETVHSRLDTVTLPDFTENELVLVTSRQNKQAETVRTLEAALNDLGEIHTTADAVRELRTGITRWQLTADSLSNQLAEACMVDAEGLESINVKLQSGAIAAALVPRSSLPALSETTRPLLTPLPWQSTAFLRDLDKLFFLAISRDQGDFIFKARELDCSMRFLGPAFETRTASWPNAARQACSVVTRAFAPMARVEEAEARSAELRLRAGGLILDPRNPAAVAVGDVMQPIVRRDDRNGVPTLLEPLSWTFAAVTESDGVKMLANVYTYSGGPGLQGRKNRRTQRMLLKVRPRL